MSTPSAWILALFILGLAPWSPAASEPEFQPEMLLPETSLGYISIPTSRSYGDRLLGTALGEIWKSEEVQRFLKRPLEKFRETVDTWSEIQVRRHQVDPRKFLSPWPHRMVAAVLNWDSERNEPSAAFLALQFPGDGKEARGLAENLIRAAAKEKKFDRSEYEHAGGKVTRIAWKEKQGPSFDFISTSPAIPDEILEKMKKETTIRDHAVEFTFRSGWLLLIFDDGPEGKTQADMRRLFDQKDSLEKAPLFRAAAGKLGFSSAEPFVFFNVGELLKQVRSMMAEEEKKDEKGDETSPEEKDSGLDVLAILDGLGISGIRSLSWIQRIDGKSMSDDVFLEVPEPRKGIFRVLAAGSSRGDLARFMSGDSQTYQEMAVDWASLWGVIRDTVKAAVDEETYQKFQEAVAEMEKTAGFSLEKDLLPCLGTHLALGGTVGQLPAMVGKNLFVLDLKDGKKLEELLGKLRKIPEVQESLMITDGEYEGVKTTSFTIRNFMLPLQPSYAITEGHLLMSESLLSLQSMIDSLRGKVKRLDEVPAFQEHRKTAFDEGTIAGSYYDLKGYLGALYTVLASTMSLVFGMDPEAKKSLDEYGIDFALLPSQKAVTDPLFPGTETLRVETAGFRYSGSSPFGSPLLGIFKIASAIGGAVGFESWIKDEIEGDRERICRGNLEKIRDAIRVYRDTTGGGSPPRDLLDLVRSGALDDASHLRCPSDKSPRKVADPDTGDEVAVSYRYIPENYGHGKKRVKVIDEDDPQRHRNGSFVLYSDGSIEKLWKWQAERENVHEHEGEEVEEVEEVEKEEEL